jgi:hypothetical protein
MTRHPRLLVLVAAALAVAGAAALFRLTRRSDGVELPPPARAALELLPFADAPVGTRVKLDHDVLTTPKVLLRGAGDRVCEVVDGDRSVRCSDEPEAPSSAWRRAVPKLPTGPLLRVSPLPSGASLALIGKPEKSLDRPPGAVLVAVDADGDVARVAAPELDTVDEWSMTLADDWILWIDRTQPEARVMGRRWDPAARVLRPSLVITTTASSMSFVDSCVRTAGRVVLLGGRGEPRYQARDPFLALFQSSAGWQSVAGGPAHLYPDPNPAFDRAVLDCDDAGFWLTWASRAPGMHFARCTPAGCRQGTFELRGVAIPNSRVVELGGRVFLVTTRSSTWGITLRSGTLDEVAGAPVSTIVEGANVEDIIARNGTAVILARSTEQPLRAALFRLDATGRVEAIQPAK